MTENAKTISFVIAGVLAIAIGFLSAPRAVSVDDTTTVELNLTKEFKQAEDAKRLRISRFDEDTATPHNFEVAEVDGLWTIPSKDGYPADATKQMAEAATSLMDRKVLHLASKNAGDHEQYGVVDPLSEKLEPGQKGVGTRVTISDAQNKPLVDLIIGKAVRDAEGQRYVREAGRDAVYVIEIDPAKLSTNFEDWIEKDLLKLNGWDLKRVEVKDYSSELVQGVTPDGRVAIGINPDYRSDMTFDYSDADAKWTPVKLQKYDAKKGKEGTYVDFKLANDEELNTETLNALKTSLDDLKIVDVRKKPQGLSQNLKAGADFVNSREAQIDLMTKGFTAVSGEKDSPGDIVSNDGEVIATMKNGTEYVLRFGNMTDVAGSHDKADEKPAKAESKDKKGDKSDVHRYLFVMARFNKDSIKQPELIKLPDLPAGAEKKDDAAADKDKAAAEQDKDKESSKDAKKDKDKKDDAAAKSDVKTETAANDKKDESAEKKEGDAADKKDSESDKEMDKVIAERKKLEQENQRKLDEYQALVKKGEQEVKDLNLRFGDWYFVVNDDVFQKVRVSREKAIKKKDEKKEGAAPAPGRAVIPKGIPGLPIVPGAGK